MDSDARVPVFAVLAHGEAAEVDEHTKVRIEYAVRCAADLETHHIPVILCMAGVGKKPSDQTLASRMAEYALSACRRLGLSPGAFTVEYNAHERDVWGTCEEVKWAWGKAHQMHYPFKLWFVTNARHARRVRFIAWSYEIEEYKILESSDPKPSVFHEILGYGKLMALSLKVPFVERFRRRFYSGE